MHITLKLLFCKNIRVFFIRKTRIVGVVINPYQKAALPAAFQKMYFK